MIPSDSGEVNFALKRLAVQKSLSLFNRNRLS